MIKCLIIDDEPLAQRVLETYTHRVGDLFLVATCESPVDAYDVLQKQDVDLIFCDIQMPEITGIEFIRSLQNPPHIIFITAFSEYAVDGFNVDAIDYLLKPVSFDRFLRSINKVKSFIGVKNNRTQKSTVNHFFVKESYKLLKINYHDIFFIEGLKDYMKIFTKGKVVITHMTMKKLEGLLPQEFFFRVHKSFIVRLDAIIAIDGNTIETINNAKVPIGLQYRDAVMNRLNNVC